METPQHGAGKEADRPAEGRSPPRVRPTPQGAVYLWTIGLFSLTILVLGENLVFLLGALVLGCGAVAWFLARRNLRRVLVERRAPARSRVGLPTALTWSVSNEGARPALGIEIEDKPARGLHPVRLHLEFPCVEGRGEQQITTQVVFGRRGWVDLGAAPLTVASRFPLGLFRAETTGRATGRICVRPAEGRATPGLRERLRGRQEAHARRRQPRPGRDVIYGVREFREGDDPRRIHWRSTARRGVLVVSEWRTEQGREAVIVLGRGQGAGPGAEAVFERAVSSAATLWRACATAGLPARLVLGGSGRDLALLDGGRGLGRGLDALATVSAQAGRRPRKALRALGQATAARTVLYVGCGEEPGLEQDLAAAAGRAGSHFLLRADRPGLQAWVRGLE